jgi:hypothetical protein
MVESIARARRVTRSAILLACAAIMPTLADAQGLPPAQQLIAKHVAASGAASWKTHKSARMKATMDMPGAGISAPMEVLHIYPSQSFSKVEIAGMGQILSGLDGNAAWMTNPMTGPRVLTGAELEAMKTESDPAWTATRVSAEVVKSETIEKTTMGGQECYKVKYTWKSGKESFDCFSVADGLLVASMQKQQTPMGEVEATQIFSAYKDFGGMKRPTTITQEAMGQQQIITLTAWEWDNVDPKEIVVPDDIKAMLGKKP